MCPSTQEIQHPGMVEQVIPDTSKVHLSAGELSRASKLLSGVTSARDRIVSGAVVGESEVRQMLEDLQGFLSLRYGQGRKEDLELKPKGAIKDERFEIGFRHGEPVEVIYYSPNGMKVSGASGVSVHHQAILAKEDAKSPTTKFSLK